MKGRILYIAAYNYLAFPHYFSIVPFLDSYRNIYVDLPDLVSNSYNSKIDKKYEKLNEVFDNVIRIASPKLSFNYQGDFYNRVITWIKEKRNFYRYNNIITGFYDELNPKAIVSISDKSLIDRISYEWCNKNQVPFIILQPSFIDAKLFFTNSTSDDETVSPSQSQNISNVIIKSLTKMKQIFTYLFMHKILGVPINAKQPYYGYEDMNSHLILWSKKFLYRHDRPNVHYGGNPAFDELFQSFNEKERRIKKDTILICTEDIDNFLGKEVLEMVVEIYREAIVALQDKMFIMKVHPREDIEKYKSFYDEEIYQNLQIVKNRDLYDLFQISDIQISINSYSSLEAAAFGIPVITVTPRKIFEEIIEFFNGNINIRVKSGFELIEAINKIYNDGYYESFLEERENYFKGLFTHTAGKSSEKIAKIIDKIID